MQRRKSVVLAENISGVWSYSENMIREVLSKKVMAELWHEVIESIKDFRRYELQVTENNLFCFWEMEEVQCEWI